MFFRPSFPKNALDIESNYITALSLEKKAGRHIVNRMAIVPVPENTIVPNFSEKNIQNPEMLLNLLEQAVENADLKRRKKWSIALPNETIRTALITIENPPKSKNEFYEILDWKSERAFGVPAEELRLAHEKISIEQPDKAKYLVTAIKLSVLQEYENLFEHLRWHAGLILPRLLCEMKWLLTNTIGDSLLISLHSDGFSSAIIQSSVPSIIRNVNCAWQEVEDEIYRFLMFYREKFNPQQEDLFGILIVGDSTKAIDINKITTDVFGYMPKVLSPEDVNLYVPMININSDTLVASAGLASLAWK